jgi:hypothetical protein
MGALYKPRASRASFSKIQGIGVYVQIPEKQPELKAF